MMASPYPLPTDLKFSAFNVGVKGHRKQLILKKPRETFNMKDKIYIQEHLRTGSDISADHIGL